MKLFCKYFGSIFNIAPYMYCLKQMVQIYEHYNLTDSHLCLAYDIVNALVEHNRNIIPPFLIFHHINTNFKTSFQTYIYRPRMSFISEVSSSSFFHSSKTLFFEMIYDANEHARI